MLPAYKDWITANVPDRCAGLCGCLTKYMAERFPELVRVNGHVECQDSSIFQHWWCVDSKGSVVDPTASQFHLYGGVYAYKPLEKEPKGKCLQCGNLIFQGSAYCCSEDCRIALDHSLNFGRCLP